MKDREEEEEDDDLESDEEEEEKGSGKAFSKLDGSSTFLCDLIKPLR